MINSVRNTVLSVLNKNNYGYISPSDFNLYANQAQMELYEEYFSNYNKAINLENKRMFGSDYADLAKTLAEVLDIFIVSNNLHQKTNPFGVDTNQYFNPSLTTTGDKANLVSKVVCYTTKKVISENTDILVNALVDATVDFTTLGIVQGDIVVNLSTTKTAYVLAVGGPTQLLLDSDIFLVVGDDYTIYSATDYSEAERVSNGKIAQLNATLLTAPSVMFPAYTQTDEVMTIYPPTIKGYGAVMATYFRFPKTPKWTYVTLANGEPAFDQSQPDYQDFELPNDDEYRLVMKILQYCGISIREQQVAQFAMAQEQVEQPTFSQQQ